jgi:putative endopeptidase
MKKLKAISILFSCLGFFSCRQTVKPVQTYLDLSGIDSAVKPGNDFYLYANGKWFSKAIIPPTEVSVGGADDLYNNTQDVLHQILDSLSKAKLVSGTIEQKVGDFYASGMDSITIDKLGFEPLKPYLEKIDSMRNASDIMRYVVQMQQENKTLLLNLSIAPDEKNSNLVIANFGQGGLGLPDRDFYFKTDSATLAIVRAYHIYLEKLFRLIGQDSISAKKNTVLVYELEKKMAVSHKTNVALRDPQSNYHKIPVSALNKQMPRLAWSSTLKAMGIEMDSVNLTQPAFYQKLNELLGTAGIDAWKAYIKIQTIDFSIYALSSNFYNTSFDYSKVVYGTKESKPRWFRMVALTDRNLGDALGEIYVKKYFSGDAKARMLELVNNLQTAFDARIKKLDWMSDSTKTRAIGKLHAFIKKIGYPDKWKKYDNVIIVNNRFFENRISLHKNEYQRQLTKLGKPVDRAEWDMTPPTINAYYNPNFNEIVFPAGFLQPPFFDMHADDAINYGAIGSIIGHEMSHAFDDQGAQYDKDGNLKNWWARADSVKFVERTKAVRTQFDGFLAIDTLHVNGALTLGENIADLGGLNIAYDAFKLTKQGMDTIRIDGLLPDERFFLSFAIARKSKYKDELMRQIVLTDSHSPDQFRVNGPLENFTPFYHTYHLQKGDKMFKTEADRIKIW